MAHITIFHWRDYKHPELGGSTMSIVRIGEYLVKQGHTVTFLTEKHSKNLPMSETLNGITYIRKGNKFTQFIALPLYFLQHLKTQTDVVIEAYDAWPYLTPLVHDNVIMQISHLQDEEWTMEFGRFMGPILKTVARTMLKLFYKNSNIVAISESTKQSILAEGIKSKTLTVIPVGVEDLIFTDKIPEKVTDRIICCTPSRLKSHKRFDLAIKLVADYNTNKRPTDGKFVYFDIVGAGDHEPVLRKLVKDLHMEDYIAFHGRAPDDIKRDLLSKAHLHFQLSKREGWGLTVIEAAAQGAPTVCFDIPGLRDSVSEETGYIVHDEKELFERFPKIVAEVESNAQSYKDRVVKGFAFSQQFGWRTLLSKWGNLIERVLGRSAPQR